MAKPTNHKKSKQNKPRPQRTGRWSQKRIARWLLLILIILSAWMIPPILEREQAVYDGHNWSPDFKHKIVIYKVPKVFGSAQAHAAHIVLEDKDGNELKRMRINHIQDLKDIVWNEQSVTVNGTRWQR